MSGWIMFAVTLIASLVGGGIAMAGITIYERVRGTK